jgi:cytochrome c oxidase assembly factor CtaG
VSVRLDRLYFGAAVRLIDLIDTGLLLGFAVVGVLYVRGCRRKGVMNATSGFVFGIGFILAGVLLLSPLNEFLDASQTTHMARHMLLAFLVAPLLVKGEAAQMVAASRGSIAPMTRPYAATAWLCFVATMIAWHLPRPFAWAVTEPILQTAGNLCFLGGGYLFWSMVLKIRGQRSLGDGTAVLFCASAIAVTDLIGAVMTLSRRLLYQPGLCRSETIGMTQLQDQQLAGLLMWIPGTVILVMFCAWMFPSWLKHAERKSWSAHQDEAQV